MRHITRKFKALSDPSRLRILKMLQHRALCVCEITELLELATSTVSKHLSILRDAGFVTDYKEGKWVYYQLADHFDEEHTRSLLQLAESWLEGVDVIRKDKLRVTKVDKDTICGINQEN